MPKRKEIKTNAMRILEAMKISYTHITYECREFVDGLQRTCFLFPMKRCTRRW